MKTLTTIAKAILWILCGFSTILMVSVTFDVMAYETIWFLCMLSIAVLSYQGLKHLKAF